MTKRSSAFLCVSVTNHSFCRGMERAPATVMDLRTHFRMASGSQIQFESMSRHRYF